MPSKSQSAGHPREKRPPRRRTHRTAETRFTDDKTVVQHSAESLKTAPSADLVSLAGRIPAELLQQLSTAVESGHWLFATWHIDDGQIQLRRTATHFPTADLDPAIQLLREDFQQLKSP